MRNSKQVLILIGPPGAGKGTQSILLSEKFNLYYLETSKIIETKMAAAANGYETVGSKKYSLAEEKKRWEQGDLVSTELVTSWVEKKIEKLAKAGKGLMMAGSPRTVYEAKELMPFLEKLYRQENIKVFLIKLSLEQSVWRNSHRRLCQLMRHPILWNEENKDLKYCPLDGSKLVKRGALDLAETIKERYRVYEKRTLPVIDYCRRHNFRVQLVDGEKSPAEVFSQISKLVAEK
jgi:adenylate kinase